MLDKFYVFSQISRKLMPSAQSKIDVIVIVEKSEMKRIDSKSFEAGPMVSPCPGLRELAELVGVECEYVDGRGHCHQATDDTLRMILRALGYRCSIGIRYSARMGTNPGRTMDQCHRTGGVTLSGSTKLPYVFRLHFRWEILH